MKAVLLISQLLVSLGCAKAITPIDVSDQAPAVAGGRDVAATDPIARSTVVIYRLNKEKTKLVGVCSGSIIHRDLVVTAAHCLYSKDQVVEPGQLVVYFGDRLSEAALEINSSRTLVSFRIQPEYTPLKDGYIHGDIAILRLNGELPEGRGPATLLERGATIRSAVIAGYGLQSPLGPDWGEFLQQYRGYHVGAQSDANLHMIRLQGRPYKGMLMGDSGGPVFGTSERRLKLCGVASIVATEVGLAYYEDIRSHVTWIEQAAKEMGSDFHWPKPSARWLRR